MTIRSIFRFKYFMLFIYLLCVSSTQIMYTIWAGGGGKWCGINKLNFVSTSLHMPRKKAKRSRATGGVELGSSDTETMYMPKLSTKTPPLPQAPHSASAPGSRMPSPEPTGPVCSYIQTRILVIYPKHSVNFHSPNYNANSVLCV